MNNIPIEDALEDSPQIRHLLSLFENDSVEFKNYISKLQAHFQSVVDAQRQLSTSSAALSSVLRQFNSKNFSLESPESILHSTVNQLSLYFKEISDLQQTVASHFEETVLFPFSRFLLGDTEELQTLSVLFHQAAADADTVTQNYCKLSRKRENILQKHEIENQYFLSRQQFHHLALEYYSALNALQYKKKITLLEPLLAYLQGYKTAFTTGNEIFTRKDQEYYLADITSSIQGVHQELLQSVAEANSRMNLIEQNCQYLYYADPSTIPGLMANNKSPSSGRQEEFEKINVSDTNKEYELSSNPQPLSAEEVTGKLPQLSHEIEPDLKMTHKSGYLLHRIKFSLLQHRWDIYYFFTQGGNLMIQNRNEIAGKVAIDLNKKGVYAAPVEIDDRCNVFQVVSPENKMVLYLQALNAKETTEWIATLNNIATDQHFILGTPPQLEKVLAEGYTATESNETKKAAPDAVDTDTSPMKPLSIETKEAREKETEEPLLHEPRSKSISPIMDKASKFFSNLSITKPSKKKESPDKSLPLETTASISSLTASLLATPVQFDLISESVSSATDSANDSHKETPNVELKQNGTTVRSNPFDVDHSADELATDPADVAFCEKYIVRFLGSKQISSGDGKSTENTIREVLAARALHNIFSTSDLLMTITVKEIKLMDRHTKMTKSKFNADRLSFWNTHPENDRLFAFATKLSDESCLCHVFECDGRGTDICSSFNAVQKLVLEKKTKNEENRDISSVQNEDRLDNEDKEHLTDDIKKDETSNEIKHVTDAITTTIVSSDNADETEETVDEEAGSIEEVEKVESSAVDIGEKTKGD